MSYLSDREYEILGMCMNYDDREAQLSDNYSNGDVETFADILDVSEDEIREIVSVLDEAGLAFIEMEDVNGIEHEAIQVTECGVHEYFAHVEAEQIDNADDLLKDIVEAYNSCNFDRINETIKEAKKFLMENN